VQVISHICYANMTWVHQVEVLTLYIILNLESHFLSAVFDSYVLIRPHFMLALHT
jgi:hypothetical protein